MAWQDIVFTLGSVVFTIALIPSLTGKDKPAFATSLVTGIVLLMYVFTYTTLSLWLSAITQFVVALLWLMLAFQRYTTTKRKT